MIQFFIFLFCNCFSILFFICNHNLNYQSKIQIFQIKITITISKIFNFSARLSPVYFQLWHWYHGIIYFVRTLTFNGFLLRTSWSPSIFNLLQLCISKSLVILSLTIGAILLFRFRRIKQCAFFFFNLGRKC